MAISRKAIGLAKALFTPAALLAIFYAAWSSREHLIASFSSANLFYLLPSICVWILLHAVAPAFSQAGLATFGYAASFRDAFYIHNLRLPAKYLPGGIWHTVAKGADYKTRGASAFQVTGYLVMENIMLVAGASFLGSIMLLAGQAAPALEIVFWTAIAAVIALLACTPLVLRLYLKESAQKFHMWPYMLSALLVVIHWSMAATSFTLYLQAYPDINDALSFAQMAGAYLVSWAAGYVAIFAPQGIGVAEAVSASLLKDAGSITGLIVLIATFRVVVFIGDIIAWAAAYTAFYLKNKGTT
ncbi:hypothetical protein [Alcanivorax sp. 1008]|uniref:hypothetical protein n=1 Tax=Alcanivorax sp. 1008 TaxID=2816853 RepID=UPI001DF6825C|nr:hypothetical protein [Alcanivorax sp. 1008]MCC1495294.1 hypothetical protein [Alcanivorax sp. 1008]